MSGGAEKLTRNQLQSRSHCFCLLGSRRGFLLAPFSRRKSSKSGELRVLFGEGHLCAGDQLDWRRESKEKFLLPPTRLPMSDWACTGARTCRRYSIQVRWWSLVGWEFGASKHVFKISTCSGNFFFEHTFRRQHFRRSKYNRKYNRLF